MLERKQCATASLLTISMSYFNATYLTDVTLISDSLIVKYSTSKRIIILTEIENEVYSATGCLRILINILHPTRSVQLQK